MQKALTTIALFLGFSAGGFAHGDAVHVRGTISRIDGPSVSITTTAKPPVVVTFTVADYTEIDKAGKVAGLKDLKVGDRVVVEIPKGKTEAESIQVGAAPVAASATHPAEHQHKP